MSGRRIRRTRVARLPGERFYSCDLSSPERWNSASEGGSFYSCDLSSPERWNSASEGGSFRSCDLSSPESWRSASSGRSFYSFHPYSSSSDEYRSLPRMSRSSPLSSSSSPSGFNLNEMRHHLMKDFRQHDKYNRYNYAALDKFSDESPVTNNDFSEEIPVENDDFPEESLVENNVFPKRSPVKNDDFPEESPVESLVDVDEISEEEPSYPPFNLNEVTKYLLEEFEDPQKAQRYKDEFSARPGAVYKRNHIYRIFPIPRPVDDKEQYEDEMFMKAMYDHHYENPGVFNTVGALRNFRRKLRAGGHPASVLENFNYPDFRTVHYPTKYDKPNFTGPFIAGPLSEDLRDLYAKYGVTKGWGPFLQKLENDKDARLSERQLATLILDKIRQREEDYITYKPRLKHRMNLRKLLENKPKDFPTLKELYLEIYGPQGPTDEQRQIYLNDDQRFMAALRRYRAENPGSYDVLRAFRWYRKMFTRDVNYFDNPKFYHFKNFKIDYTEPGETYPQNYIGPMLSGPYTHEVEDLYQRFGVKHGEWSNFLRWLRNYNRADAWDFELAKYLLAKERNLKYDKKMKAHKIPRPLSPPKPLTAHLRNPMGPSNTIGGFRKAARKLI